MTKLSSCYLHQGKLIGYLLSHFFQLSAMIVGLELSVCIGVVCMYWTANEPVLSINLKTNQFISIWKLSHLVLLLLLMDTNTSQLFGQKN